MLIIQCMHECGVYENENAERNHDDVLKYVSYLVDVAQAARKP